jgi:hypothetical protein
VTVTVGVKVDVLVGVGVTVAAHAHARAHSLVAIMVQKSSHGSLQQLPSVAWQTQPWHVGSSHPGVL